MEFKFKEFSNPILFVGDNPAMYGGLARIGRDLATLTCTLPQFRVGYLGRGIGQNRNLPFILYDYPENEQWGQAILKEVWQNFAGNEPGIIMTLDDVSRREWMVNNTDPFYNSNRTFKTWMYTPVDSTGPNLMSLSNAGARTVAKFDRVLAASEWGSNVLNSGGRLDADWLPHGFFPDKFNTRGTHYPDLIRVGCVMANQARKHYPAAFHCFKILLNKYGNQFQAWLHTDTLNRYWDVKALADDYSMGNNIRVTVTASDDELASLYRSCACTILPSGGEGFGYPIAESMACGTACVVTNYAAGPNLVESSAYWIDPAAWQVETCHNTVRAVNYGPAFIDKVVAQIDAKMFNWPARSIEIAQKVEHLNWNGLKHSWIRWMLEGLK